MYRRSLGIYTLKSVILKNLQVEIKCTYKSWQGDVALVILVYTVVWSLTAVEQPLKPLGIPGEKKNVREVEIITFHPHFVLNWINLFNLSSNVRL